MKIWKLLVPVFALSLVVGCASKDSMGTDGADGAGGAVTSPGDSGGSGAAMPLDSDLEKELMDNTTIYFAFDKSDVNAEGVELLRLHGAYLADNPKAKARLEGHADERGSREYNLGLGERRAAAARSVLLVNGASSSQLTTISFGEERPADTGTGEVAWARNRRVVIDYQ